jgi:hypothetical protein
MDLPARTTDGMPRTLDELREIVVPIIRAEMPAMARACVAELRANNRQPPAA